MNEFLNKLNQIDKELNNNSVHQQVSEINKIIACIDQKQVIRHAPNRLGFYPDEMELLTEEIGKEHERLIKAINNLLNSFRQYLSLHYGIWSLPNLRTAQLIKEKYAANSALEVMSGNAYWSKALNDVGLQVIATDSLEWAKTSSTGKKKFLQVENLDAIKAIEKYQNVDLIICSWAPNFGHSDVKLIKAWQASASNSKLLFIGEKDGATNSGTFWSQAQFVHSKQLDEINKSFSNFDFIDEKIYEVKKI
ncbi:SAM-dependent methyltransferase [Lactobacillus agrestimuris]|uniref:SAM-dependent methyltransferase n=1 Tax=Lactobacillus agrestimuris TaxID=2941328 RepID=UPI0020444089|nr:SAM-dependent methyltransferase [Lactobacillus agrestimuris]